MARHTRRFTVRVFYATFGTAGACCLHNRWTLRRGAVAPPPNDPVDNGLHSRPAKLKQLTNLPLDVLVVGGGVIGLYTALDAAQRGLRVAVVDAGDFGSACSSSSPPLLPGAFPHVQRALRQRDLMWMRRAIEAWKARTVWLNVAPGLADGEVRTLIPSFHLLETTEIFTTAVITSLLSLFCGPWKMCRFVLGSQLEEEFAPMENSPKGAVVVQDVMLDGAGAAVALARTAEALGAVALNYASVTRIDAIESSFTKQNGPNFVVSVCDVSAPPGSCLSTDSQVRLHTRSIVNCTGSWADDVRRLLPNGASESSSDIIERHQLNSYFVLPRDAVSTGGSIMNWSPNHTRALLASSTAYSFSPVMMLPWFDRCVLLGPSVLPITKLRSRASSMFVNHESPSCETHVQTEGSDQLYQHKSGINSEKQAYVSDALRASGVEFDRERILSCISNVVPVVRSYPAGGQENTGILCEGYHISAGTQHRHVVHVYGGTICMARCIAEKAIDALLNSSETFGTDETKRLRPCRTKYLSLIGAQKSERAENGGACSPLERVRRLVSEQYAVRLVDIVARRTHVAYSSPAEALTALPAIAELMAAELGWAEERKHAELSEAYAFISSITAFS
ncbi:putative glycerol 3 phosphate dehydrogenase (FAD dependent) [Trypanosoma vivax]|uniref:Glycerol-3-phosphate dehydrogenase n=1 Tax=Trypanosoma vivax (strain Y486) TaxID=1055687 RepID=G0TR30_TRYVY|nr:glycerol-3-phosphate dehydrogenase [Trypanosoma vivax]KAH8611351.1 putative glycerol 3 phosphate dehydrogenase (FAD dependent) [Trypanosoma vivax]CCC46394.1 glycerol-3-phosphate dehydrogenase [Trypanosoma vivax Y486]